MPSFLLRSTDLPAGIRPGRTLESETPRRLSSGNAALDVLLDGGFPCGQLSEICGPAFSGRTSLLYGLLASATASGEVVALIDAADRFDPVSAEAAGIRLPALLWLRPRDARESLRCAEILLATRGFALVALDLAEAGTRALPDSAWARLARRATQSRAALLVLGERRLSGSFAHLCLGLSRARPLWLRPPLLAGIETRTEVLRRRRGPAGDALRLRIEARSA